MHSPIQLAAIAIFTLSAVVTALPGNSPPGYGTTTTSSSKTKSTCAVSTITSISTGYTTYTTGKKITKYVDSTVVQPYTTDKVKTVPWSSTFTTNVPDIKTKTVTETKSTTKTTKTTKKVAVPCTTYSTFTTSTPVVSTSWKETVVDVTTPCTTVVTSVTTQTGSHPSTIVSTGHSIVTKHETGASSYTTKAPSVSTSICTESKPFTTTKYSTTSVCGPKGY